MEIRKLDTSNPRDVRRFVSFPFELYRRCPQWVPPFVSSAQKQLNREKHPFYQHSDADFFLAERDGKTVGRIAVLEPSRHNEYRNERAAFFYLFDVVEEVEVTRALFQAAFDWARQRGLTHIIGPQGFVAGDAHGLLVEGFEHRPAMSVPYNYAYYGPFVEDSGLVKDTDYFSCYLPGDMELPARVARIAEKIKERRGFWVTVFKTKDELRRLIPRIQEVYNDAFSENRLHVPLTAAEAEAIGHRLIEIADPELIKLVMKGDEIAGFLFGFPDLSAAIQRCGGRLYPFGWLMLLREFKRTDWINFNGAGILKRYRGLGANAVLYYEMAKTVQVRGFKHADLVQMEERNEKILADLRALGAQVYKTHRIYRREL